MTLTEATEPGTRTVVLLTEETLGEHDVMRIAQLHEGELLLVHVLVPVDTQHSLVEALDEASMGRVVEAVKHPRDVAPEQAEVIARAALDQSVSALRNAGLEAEGDLTPDDPVDVTSETVERVDADEIIVVTRPHPFEEAFRRDWASRVRNATRRPVLHFIAGTDWVS